MSGISERDFGSRESPVVTDLEAEGSSPDNHTAMGLYKGMLTRLGNLEDELSDHGDKLDAVVAGLDDLNDKNALVYFVTFAGVSVSGAQDCFAVVAGTKRLCLRACRLNEYTDFGDAAAEILSVTIVRGNTVVGTGGGAFTPLKARPWLPVATFTARINDTTVASGGVAEVLEADGWNVNAGWRYEPFEAERIWLEPGQRACVRITLPADAITTNGILVCEEVAIA